MSVAASYPASKKIVLMRGSEIDDPDTLTWEGLLALGDQTPEEEVHKRIEAIEPSDPATFIYTSGTTGPPKAVMLSHDNLVFTTDAAVSLVEFSEEDCLILFAPLSYCRADVFNSRTDYRCWHNLLCRIDRQAQGQPRRSFAPPFSLVCPESGKSFHAGLSQNSPKPPDSRKF